MKKPLTVSIIIPVYNEEDYIKQCLDCIASQTVAPDEVIVVDNNSTDKTVKLARKYRFVKVVNEKQQGALYARTKGFNLAKSQIIGRIDADTRLEPGWVEQLQRIFKQSNIDAVTGCTHWYDMPLSPWNHNVENVAKYNLYRYETNFPFLYGTNMAVRKSAWNEVRSFLCQDKYIHEDSDLAIHLHQTGHKLLYDKSLRAGMSGRRSQDTISDFNRYIRLQRLTYRQHGINTIGSSVSVAGYWMAYLATRPIYRSYDVKNQRYSIKQLVLGKRVARVHPFES